MAIEALISSVTVEVIQIEEKCQRIKPIIVYIDNDLRKLGVYHYLKGQEFCLFMSFYLFISI